MALTYMTSLVIYRWIDFDCYYKELFMQIQWDKRFSVGNDQIDEQHKQLLHYYNQFSEACAKGNARKEVVHLFGFLHRYVQEHFAAEEKLMDLFSYPALPKHRLAHVELKDSLKKLSDQLQGETVPLGTVIEASRMLIKWVLDHIGKEDAALGEYLSVRMSA